MPPFKNGALVSAQISVRKMARPLLRWYSLGTVVTRKDDESVLQETALLQIQQ